MEWYKQFRPTFIDLVLVSSDECGRLAIALIKASKMTGKNSPDIDMRQYGEWTFYPEGSHYGKRCYIDGERKGNCQTYRETTLVDVIGRTKKVSDKRAGLPQISDGDKSYLVPEYSFNFHQVGSTRPVIDFSRSSHPITDTFIPLEPLHRRPRRTYTVKNKKHVEEEEKREVASLSRWRPSPKLTPTL